MSQRMMDNLDTMLITRYTDPDKLRLVERFVIHRYGTPVLSGILVLMIILLAKHLTALSVIKKNKEKTVVIVFNIVVESVVIVLCLAGILMLEFTG